MNSRLLILAGLLLSFTVYSVTVVLEHGYFGFIELALAEDWAAQMLIDLIIALTLFVGWMVPDARARGLKIWPYTLLIATLGSIGALAYLVRRELDEPARARAS